LGGTKILQRTRKRIFPGAGGRSEKTKNEEDPHWLFPPSEEGKWRRRVCKGGRREKGFKKKLRGYHTGERREGEKEGVTTNWDTTLAIPTLSPTAVPIQPQHVIGKKKRNEAAEKKKN
jgi:hypothetical protein